MKRSREALPLADAAALRGRARRTAAVRALLAVLLLLALTAAYASSSTGDPARASAGDRGRVIVLDVSGSISDDRASMEIRRALANEIRAVGPSGHIGLVLFSDVAMEALPPTAPVSALESFRRFFVPVGHQPSALAASGQSSSFVYPQSPWALSLTGGTSISTGLREARLDLARAGMSGGQVLLLSDLIDSEQDGRPLVRELKTYARTPGLDLQVRAISSAVPQPVALYRKYLGRRAVSSIRDVLAHRSSGSSSSTPVPLWLLGLGGFVAALLVAHELLAVPLRWRGTSEAAKAEVAAR